MSEQNNKSGLIAIIAVIIIALVGAGVYFTKFAKQDASVLPPVTTEEQAAVEPVTPTPEEGPIVEGEVPPQPDTPINEVVVETKKLDIPATEAAAPEVQAAAPTSSNPEVEKMMAPRFIGSPTAPVKVTEYSSLGCGHCAAFHKDMLPSFKEKFVDTGRVQLTFKEFPLNAPALDASMILRCMPEDKFMSFMDLLFTEQQNWAYKEEYKDTLRQYAKLAGMSDEQFDGCLANKDLKERLVAETKHASEAYKVASTPSFVINDGKKTVVGHQPLDFFEKAFDEVSPPTAAPAAGQ